MSTEENRSDANLLLLCIEHSYEVDELPDLYPAALLRQWKQAQLDEQERAQRGWPLTDADAGRVLEASSRAVEHHHAAAVVRTVQAAERLALAARRTRSGPAAEATAWRAAPIRARVIFHMGRRRQPALCRALPARNRALQDGATRGSKRCSRVAARTRRRGENSARSRLGKSPHDRTMVHLDVPHSR